VTAFGVLREYLGLGAAMTESESTVGKTRMQRVWAFFRRRSSMSWSALVGVGIVAGVILWGGFNWALELTSTEAFCVSCHEMRDNVYQELQQTIHWKNRSGVRAICSDCHVPKVWIYKIKRKIEASNEVFHKILGTIGTKEKFEAHRLELAQHVWATMKATDSRECRNCHAAESMDPHKQSAAASIMQDAMKNGATCIDCHKGIAHHLPKEPDDDQPAAEPEKK
jgi:nitrate/TMAO reductase-like tetraheme cytochrome c subunit